MANVDDVKIKEAYEDIRNDKVDTNWVLIDYDSEKGNTLTVTATGSGGLAELTPKFEKGNASFAYVRVKYANDEESFREKFALIVWIGEEVKVMRRARVSVHAADVKRIFSSFSIQVNASTDADLKEDDIISRLRKAGGASYDRV